MKPSRGAADLHAQLAHQADLIRRMQLRLEGHAELISLLYLRMKQRGIQSPALPHIYEPIFESRPKRKPIAVIPARRKRQSA